MNRDVKLHKLICQGRWVVSTSRTYGRPDRTVALEVGIRLDKYQELMLSFGAVSLPSCGMGELFFEREEDAQKLIDYVRGDGAGCYKQVLSSSSIMDFIQGTSLGNLCNEHCSDPIIMELTPDNVSMVVLNDDGSISVYFEASHEEGCSSITK